MPVRSLISSVLKWPDARTVELALRGWVARLVESRPEVLGVAYFGSYARGNWGPGSDLDILIIVRSAQEPFERRAAGWDATELPVPADVLVYTEDEWLKLRETGRFHDRVMREAIWMYPAPPLPAEPAVRPPQRLSRE